MGRAFRLLMIFLVVGMMASASVRSAQASWRSSVLMGPNQGYCQSGRQRADIKKCSENRTGNRERGSRGGQSPGKPNAAVREACMGDARRFCSAVIQDLETRRACMKAHRAELSSACKAALVKQAGSPATRGGN